MAGIKKSTRYDRQLRLWGQHGQDALEASKICLITAGATGTEILKNLILPGAGAVTIVDGATVTERDLGNNFFLTTDSIGHSRAEQTALYLSELNTEVERVGAVSRDIGEVLGQTPDFFKDFSLVIATQMGEQQVIKIAADLWDRDIPLVVVRSYGLMGYVRIQLREHIVIEGHPDNAKVDLRLDEPFPELLKVSHDHGDISSHSLELKDHQHVPYPIILLKALEVWRGAHGGALPSTREEKKAFKAAVEASVFSVDGVPAQEDNYEEAIKFAFHAWTTTSSKMPDGLATMFSDPQCAAVGMAQDTAIAPEWIIARALKDFQDADPHHLLPLIGAVPDLSASTDAYLRLQTAYRTRADADLAAVLERVAELSEETGGKGRAMDLEDTKRFIKHIYEIELQRGTSIQAEYVKYKQQHKDSDSNQESPVEDSDEWKLYFMMRAVDAFREHQGRYPSLEDRAGDQALLKDACVQIMDAEGAALDMDEHLHEACRWSGAELHSIASIMGGIASQEVIKIITRQFVPLDNTYVFNGVDSTSAYWKL